MEVLSCSEVQYVGETNCPQRSSDVKQPTEKHEGLELRLVDSPQIKRSIDELALDINMGEQPPIELDCTPIPYVVQSNNGSGLLDVKISQQSSKEKLFNGVNLHLDEPSNERESSISTSQSSGQIGYALTNGTHLEATIIGKGEYSDEAVNQKLYLCPNSLESQFPGVLSQAVQSGRSDISTELERIFPGLEEIQKAEQSDDKRVVRVGQSHDTSPNVVSDVQHKKAELTNISLEPSHAIDKEDGKLSMVKSEFPGGSDDNTEFELVKLEPQNKNHEPAPLNMKYAHVPNGKRVTDGRSLDAEFDEQDETVALWVKWRGKWQAGIRCARADWPLSTVKAKPTHGRKKYFVVFFPSTRTHSWADMLLVRPISDLPEPLAYGTHFSGLEMVKDLSTPRRYIMQKLAVSMLNVSDQLHTEAVIEKARQVAAWKEFALEAYHCETYADLGKMLLKLHSMILPAYIDPDWVEQSFDAWVNCCEHAQTAESVETLLKELVESVLWDQVESLWDAPVQPELGSEWKTWKQEVLKWFSTSHPPLAAPGESSELRNCDESSTSSGPNVSRKRPKLEVRRAEAHYSQVDMETDQVNIDSGFFNSGHSENVVMKEESFTDYPSGEGDGWVEIVVEAGNPDFSRNAEEAGPSLDTGSVTKVLVDGHHGSHAANKYRQCMAFIAAKGRQCGRWANDGEMYCCVHLNCRYAEKAAKVEETPPSFSNALCEGTTNHGERCKHRARFGSLYCKKHRPQGSQLGGGNPSVLPGNDLKRKFSETNSSLENLPTPEIITGKEIVLVGDQRPFMGNLNVAFEVEAPLERNELIEKPSENYGVSSSATMEGYVEEWPRCIVWGHENNSQCPEKAKLHTLYCEKHRPNFLKRARNGKSRIISKEYFLDLLRNCTLRNQKVQLHQACELLYGFMKSALNRRNRVSKEHLMEWILAEASKDLSVGDYLMRLVSLEKEKIGRLWRFDAEKSRQGSSAVSEQVVHHVQGQDRTQNVATVKCKICTEDFPDDHTLGAHWMDVHKKEAQWLFRGYACAICMNSFTNRKVLEAHVKEKHKIQSLDQYILFQCMPCGDHFVNPEQLWVHVLSFHSLEFRLRASSEQQTRVPVQQAGPQTFYEPGKNPPLETNDATDNNIDIQDGARRFICRFCGLKFDLLPDLGRHHQAAHMGPNATSHFPPKRRSIFSASSRLRPGRPRFKKGLGGAFSTGNNSSFSLKKQLQGNNSLSSSGLKLLTQVSEVADFERSIESQCSSVAEVLFKDIKQTKCRPTNLEILSVARSTCCKVALLGVLEQTYGVLPERLYLKAAKLCSELNIQVEWHREGFICPQGCVQVTQLDGLLPLDDLPDALPDSSFKECSLAHADFVGEWEMEEYHHVITSNHLEKPLKKVTILCEDISFGREQTPVACIVDEDVEFQPDLNGQKAHGSMPWEGFTYVTERLLDPSLGLDTKSSQLGCACPHSNCSPETCDHVYLFDNDYESAKDIVGRPMHGRFPYDEAGRIILEEGYLVYECNSMCSCDRTCRNRVLQNGVQLKLDIFKTKKKGWAVRAGEAIPRGTFVCEYIGEVLNDQEADKRGKRYDDEGCSYLYDIDAHIDDMGGMNEGSVPYVIDATKYGNVARFINHSCSPNLVNYQVLVASMDCQLAHIGLYANRDIAKGEELAYDYRYKLLPGAGCPCHCGASSCRGRLY